MCLHPNDLNFSTYAGTFKLSLELFEIKVLYSFINVIERVFINNSVSRACIKRIF